jgi:hypothetical protein
MEEKNENVVEETTQETQEQVEQKPEIDESKFESAGDDSVLKVDFTKPPKQKNDEQPESTSTNEEDVVQEKTVEETTNQEEVVEQVAEENTETPVLEELTEEQVSEKAEELAEEAQEAIAEAEATGQPIPENIQKLMDFMEDTGGDLNDYVKLNQDYSDMDNQDLLYEYYKQTKPHLNAEEINFLMEDEFSYNEDTDDEREIRRKKLALKEQVASAKSHLDGQKSKYYEDIKAGSKLTPEQQKAIDFFNRYNKESEEAQKITKQQTDTFLNKTNKVFNDKFKGFEYNIGDKKFRFNVKDSQKIKETQSDINNFVKKFLNKKNQMEDAAGYHKSLYTAMNADAIANHFYEQGKADALKNSVAKSKNVNMNPRQAHGKIEAGGLKFKVLGDNSSDFKFKIKNKNK